MNEIDLAFARAAGGHHEADWDRFVEFALARPLTDTEWQWLLGRASEAQELGFLAVEALVRVLAAHASTPDAKREAIEALARLIEHPSDAVKVAVLEAAAEIDVVAAKSMASSLAPRTGPLGEAIHTIEAMTVPLAGSTAV